MLCFLCCRSEACVRACVRAHLRGDEAVLLGVQVLRVDGGRVPHVGPAQLHAAARRGAQVAHCGGEAVPRVQPGGYQERAERAGFRYSNGRLDLSLFQTFFRIRC